MKLGDIAQKARDLTNTDTVSWTDAQLLVDINIWLLKTVTMILDSADDVDFDDARNTNYPIKTTPMVANQRDYTMPVSEKVLKIKRVDLCYDGTNYYRATPYDSGEYPRGLAFNGTSGADSTTDQNFQTSSPSYDVAYSSLWLYPMPTSSNMTNGIIRIEWERQPAVFTTADYTSVLTDSTVVPGFDDPFHPILAYGPAMEYAARKNQPQLGIIQQQLTDYETRLRSHYGRKDWDRGLTFDVDYTNSYK